MLNNKRRFKSLFTSQPLLSNNNRKHLRLLCLVLALSLLTSCAGGSAASRDPMLLDEITGSQTSFDTYTVEPGSLSRRISGEGVVNYPVSRSITCTLSDAVLVGVYVSNNALVSKGDVIAEFEISYSESELNTLRSNLEIAKKQYSLSLSAYDTALRSALEAYTSAQQRYDAGEITENQLKKAALSHEKAALSRDFFVYQQERQISAQQKAIDDFVARISDNKIIAPFDGVIENTSYLTVGTTIPRGTLICNLYSTETVWLSTTLDVQNGMRYNQNVSITVTNHDRDYSGRIISAPNVLGESLGRVTIRPDEPLDFDVSNRLRRISVITMRYEIDNVLVLPTSAVQNEDGKRYVYLLEDGIVKKRYVTCGLSDNTSIQIIEGLEAGQTVVKY